MTSPIITGHGGGVARITLNRPDKLNAFTAELHADLRRALGEIESTADIRCLVISGGGRAFCAGQDLNERARAPGEPAPDLGETLDRDMNPLIRRLRALPVPVIAAVNGVAAGAGASLALAADIVLAGRSAKFSLSFCRIGLIPDGAATWILPRIIGPARAAGLALTGEAITAEQAAAWGLIWKCIDDDALAGEADQLAAYFVGQPAQALAATKLALQSSWSHDLDEQLELERRLQRACSQSADYAEGVAAFLERRPARFGAA